MKKIMILILVVVFLCPVVFGETYLLKQIIGEGETQVVTINGWDYEVELVMVSDQAKKAVFRVNGESTDSLSEDGTYRFSDGSSLLAREILVQEGGDGKDMVQYNLYAGKSAPAPVAEVVEEKVVANPEPIVEPEIKTLPEPKVESVAMTEEGQEVKDDTTRIVMKKKSLWGRFVDWFKGIF